MALRADVKSMMNDDDGLALPRYLAQEFRDWRPSGTVTKLLLEEAED